MTVEWISASRALKMMEAALPTERAKYAIWTAGYGGQVKARAARLLHNDHPRPAASIPAPFWRCLGLTNCAADWETGHFMAMVQPDRWQAFGVEFSFEDVLNLIPAERRGMAVLASSVAGDPAFVSATKARSLVYNEAGINPAKAGAFILDKCRMGLIGGRAVQMRQAFGSKPGDWDERCREWDISSWFWRDFTDTESSSQDWDIGTFAGKGFREGKTCWMTLRGVAFDKLGLSLFVPSLRVAADASSEDAVDPSASLPRLADAPLQRWWDTKASVRESLSLDELLTLVRAAFPENHVARDRIRDLGGGRKRGPKRFGGKRSAE